MSIARDQTPSGQTSSSASSVTLTWGTNPAAGAKVLIAVYCATSTVSTVKDNGTVQTTFTDDKDNAGASGWAYIYRGDSISLPGAGSYAVTVTFAGTATGIFLAGRSYTGAASGAPAGTGTASGSSNAPNTGNVAPGAANSLLFGFFIDGSSASETITLTTSGANGIFTSSAGTVVNGAAADNIPSSTASQNIAWSLSDSVGWGGLVAAYTPAGTAAPPGAAGLVPPGIASPMVFRRRALPSQAPLEITASDSGTGNDTAPPVTAFSASAQPGRARPGQAQPGNPGPPAAPAPQVPYALLIPPGFTSPASFQRHAFPAPAPVLTPSADTGTGADSGTVTATVSDSDTGTGADTASVTVTGGPQPPAAVLVPPAPFTPMTFQRQAWPSPAPVLVQGQDTGSGTDTGQPAPTDTDTGSGTETATVTVTGTETGAAAESISAGPPVSAFPVIPPGFASPMAFQRQVWPSPAPLLASSADAGSGADSAAVTATVSGSDTGAGADTAIAGPLPGTGLAGIPPGFASPMAWQFQVRPTQAVAETAVADSGTGTDSAAVAFTGADTGTAADTAQVVLVTGTGIVQRLNPVREAMTGLDVTLHMSQALGAVIQFASHGSERLYVLAAQPGVTLTVTDGGMVLTQDAQPFPAVELTAGALYCFGPFHSVLQVPGTSTIQVALSTAYGVQVVVVQGPDAH